MFSIFTKSELQLIICCARTELNEVWHERIRNLLKQDLDWNYLITIAKLHKVAPLVFVNLINTFPEAIPANVLPQLQNFVKAVIRKNLYLVRESIVLKNIFESNDIPAIPYKGPTLAAALYGDLCLRQFVDLDFLVPKQKYLEAQKLLINTGYQPPPQNNVVWERSFVHTQKRIGVDLHQGLTPDYLPVYIDFQGLWQRLEPVSIGGVDVKSFAPEDLLIVLCIQLAKDSQWTAEVLSKVCDIAELLRTYPNLDWDLVWQRCIQLGTKRILLFALYVSHKMLDAELPRSIWQKIRADVVAIEAAEIVCEEFFLRSPESFAERIFQERIYLRKLARERWQDKVNYFVRTVLMPNENEFALFTLPKQLFFLYYLLRPIRLSGKFLKNLWLRFTGDRFNLNN